MVIGADGQRSIVRRHLGIELDQRTPPQTAIVCTATHALDQEAVSTEFHRDAGPFTLVPAQPDAQGRQRTAIVWVEAPAQAKALQALPAEAFLKGASGKCTRLAWARLRDDPAHRHTGRDTAKRLSRETRHLVDGRGCTCPTAHWRSGLIYRWRTPLPGPPIETI